MNQRERLIELLNKQQDFGGIFIKSQMDDRYTKIREKSNEDIADRLIASGVTVSTDKPAPINLSSDFFGTILTCAVRYALGRQSYMPGLVIDFITPLLPELCDKTLWCLEKDIAKAENWGGYGDETIDKPKWMQFLTDIRSEQNRRKEIR